MFYNETTISSKHGVDEFIYRKFVVILRNGTARADMCDLLALTSKFIRGFQSFLRRPCSQWHDDEKMQSIGCSENKLGKNKKR